MRLVPLAVTTVVEEAAHVHRLRSSSGPGPVYLRLGARPRTRGRGGDGVHCARISTGTRCPTWKSSWTPANRSPNDAEANCARWWPCRMRLSPNPCASLSTLSRTTAPGRSASAAPPRNSSPSVAATVAAIPVDRLLGQPRARQRNRRSAARVNSSSIATSPTSSCTPTSTASR